MNDDVLTRNSDGELAVRTVSSTETATVVNPNDVYTRDTDGNLCIRTVGGSGGDQHNLGYYASESALTTAHPTATDGDWAIVGTTDTIWIWDSDTNTWVDTGNAGIELPDQTGNAGKFLKTDGETASWENITITPATAPTLVAKNWSSNTQTITVQGVTANNTVIVGPIPTDAQDYADAGILCTGQALNSLTFTCVDVPATDLQVNIVIM